MKINYWLWMLYYISDCEHTDIAIISYYNFPFLSILSSFKRTKENGIIHDAMNWLE